MNSCMKINIKVFYKLITSFLLVIAKHAQSTQNSKFVISLQYPKKEGRDEVDFLHADQARIQGVDQPDWSPSPLKLNI